MLKKLKYMLLFMLLLAGKFAMSEEYVIDKVCVGFEGQYKVDGMAGSTYTWTLTDQTGVETVLPETGDMVTILWSTVGTYHLATVQHSLDGCNADIQVGIIEVYELPTIYAGKDDVACDASPYLLAEATGDNYSSLNWTSSGDGTFDLVDKLNPIYTFGPNDILAGTVTLKVTAKGLGDDSSCPPAESSIIITLNDLQAVAISVPASCSGVADGSATITAQGGFPPYTYVIGTDQNNTGEFSGLLAGTYQYKVIDSESCEFINDVTITAPDRTATLFTQIDPICQGDIVTLPTLSSNGFKGTWNPATINTDQPGITTYTFTPDADQCATTFTMDIQVIKREVPLFDQIQPICEQSNPVILPLTSNNGISGTWYPDMIDSGVQGDYTFTFTPDAGECASSTTMTVTVKKKTVPEFDDIKPLCINTPPPVLPTTSKNGVPGVWDADITTDVIGVKVYTFTPLVDCAEEAKMVVQVTDNITTQFGQIGPLCQFSSAPELPLTSSNGITGSWDRPISTTTPGDDVYTFTPDPGQCASEYKMTIKVNEQFTPTFLAIDPICQYSVAPELPTTSVNGLAGSWDKVIDTDIAGITTYTFTPDDPCAVQFSMDIEVIEKVTPTFAQFGPFCQIDAPFTLPTISDNGIEGTWDKATVDNSTPGTFTYTFIPDAKECAFEYPMQIEILEFRKPTFAQIGPVCQNSSITLPDISLEGINGTWDSPVNTSQPGTFTYTFTPTDICVDKAIMTIEVIQSDSPVFDLIDPLCQNSVAPVLPTTSNNGITGTWSDVIKTDVPGTLTLTFTPDDQYCSSPYNLTVQVIPELKPQFTAIGPLCQNSPAPELPITSLDGTDGTWDMPISTADVGTFIYTFTPVNTGATCAVPTEMQVVITKEIQPTFTQIGPLCLNSPAVTLPLTSLEGIEGTWSPSIITTDQAGATTYLFTPTAGQCALTAEMTVTITDLIKPTFTSIDPIYQYSQAPTLPTTSLEGIKGTWNPSTISTDVIGQITYTFTPDPGQCADNAEMIITIQAPIKPTFDLYPLCINSTPPPLPSMSKEGITGSWSPSVINTSKVGDANYTFTPNAGQNAIAVTVTLTVKAEIEPAFDKIPEVMCKNSTPPVLPKFSNNNIRGKWQPAVINTADVGTASYFFIPDTDIDQCANLIYIVVTIVDQITPEFNIPQSICINSTAPVLPKESLNGIKGSWSPLTVNTSVAGKTTYKFTPEPDQCAAPLDLEIEVLDKSLPMFSIPSQLCKESVPPLLPKMSDDNIPGKWIPAVINVTNLGKSVYEFTPEEGYCADKKTIEIEIVDEIIPVFDPIGPLCYNSGTFELPLVSKNGIKGSWNEKFVKTNKKGTIEYIFTPGSGTCAIGTSIFVTVQGPEISDILAIPSTNNMSNGIATIEASGNSPLEYSLDGTTWQDNKVFENLPEGKYTAWVKDATDCIITLDFEISHWMQGIINLTAGRVMHCINEEVDIPVIVENFKDVTAFRLQITFDPSKVMFSGIGDANKLLAKDKIQYSETGTGILLLTYIANDPTSISNNELLLNLQFMGIEAGLTKLEWTFLECQIRTSELPNAPAIYTSGMYEVFAAPDIKTTAIDPMCQGETLVLSATSNDNQKINYTWEDPSGNRYPGSTVTIQSLSTLDAGNYSITADNGICMVKNSVDVVVFPKPNVQIAPSDSVCLNDHLLLETGGGFIEYEWQDGSSLPSFYAVEPGVYWVRVVDQNHCEAKAAVELIECVIEALIPNAFTPNGDGLNDKFRAIFDGCQPTKYKMSIYTQWGELIFTTDDIGEGWDGTSKGVLMPVGTYAYSISYEVPGYVTKKGISSPMVGRVSLLR